jgi:hypothetical protein
VALAKHLTKHDIQAILNIILGFNEEKLTWEYVCDAAEKVVGKKPTRQSLYSNKAIREAYVARKKGLKVKEPTKPKPSSLKIAADRISRLENEVEILKRKNDALLEQFVIWQYNVYKHGLKDHQLNQPLPRIDRDITDIESRKTGKK